MNQCNNCKMNYEGGEFHCCDCKQNFIKMYTTENHCCKCKMNYRCIYIFHCCDCKQNFITRFYNGNHCCKCKITYSNVVSHCCIHNSTYLKNDNCDNCFYHKELYQHVMNEIEYYPNLGIKYFEAKCEYDKYM
jgi:hypothetical protein